MHVESHQARSDMKPGLRCPAHRDLFRGACRPGSAG